MVTFAPGRFVAHRVHAFVACVCIRAHVARSCWYDWVRRRIVVATGTERANRYAQEVVDSPTRAKLGPHLPVERSKHTTGTRGHRHERPEHDKQPIENSRS